MQIKILILLLLGTQGALAQFRIYPVGSQYAIGDAQGTFVRFRDARDVSVVLYPGTATLTVSGEPVRYATYDTFLNRDGQPYGLTYADALNSWRTTIGNFTTVGSVLNATVDYTTSGNTVPATGAFKYITENLGGQTATLTYGGFVYTLNPGEQRLFSTELDLSSNKLTPLSSLVVNATGTTVRVLIFKRQ
ncbi:hypothetical protein [Spirosoma sordidisoli]|uniref:Uncharacterized protein n=1 Tax=Spirosoma sordidisoli TaxID=2502893 RepID=A0A4Q2UM17_9BACT|nr:hypothetical protein [Spirosoma sordidisoli]RYC70647.1 hypothetical protein EQG79_00410 [Spirosoma sordidisoli]